MHGSVRKLFAARIATLSYRYRKTHNQDIKAELDRLTAELERLPERWEFRAGS
jgi:biopolymer transport protein ExbB/TolQ